MTSREHYQRGLALLREVEEMEHGLDKQQFTAEVAMVLNANMMRTLKKVEVHFMAASLKVTLDR